MKYCPECGQRIPTPPPITSPWLRRFEYTRYGSDKFWETWRHGYTVYVRFGRIGTEGQTTMKEHSTVLAAINYQSSKIKEKNNKGYHEV